MQKNYVQEILSIIHSGLPKAELAEKLSDYHEKDLADALEALTPPNVNRSIPFWAWILLPRSLLIWTMPSRT